MNINEILKGVECQACGKTHLCPIKEVYIENGAIKHLKKIANDYNNILIVADENTIGAVSNKVDLALAQKNVQKIIFTERNKNVR